MPSVISEKLRIIQSKEKKTPLLYKQPKASLKESNIDCHTLLYIKQLELYIETILIKRSHQTNLICNQRLVNPFRY